METEKQQLSGENGFVSSYINPLFWVIQKNIFYLVRNKKTAAIWADIWSFICPMKRKQPLNYRQKDLLYVSIPINHLGVIWKVAFYKMTVPHTPSITRAQGYTHNRPSYFMEKKANVVSRLRTFFLLSAYWNTTALFFMQSHQLPPAAWTTILFQAQSDAPSVTFNSLLRILTDSFFYSLGFTDFFISIRISQIQPAPTLLLGVS